MAIPSKGWFPTTLQDRAAWFQNFRDQFSALAAALGFAPADVTAVDNDNSAFQWLAATAVTVESFSQGMTAYRKLITEGDIGEPAAVVPAPPVFALVPTVDPGIFERLIALVERIRVAPNYSPEEGELLGIIPAASSSIAPDDLQPSLKAKAMPANVVMVEFVRGKTQGIAIETKVDNDAAWSTAGSFFKSPAQLTIAASPGNLPRAVQIRARYLQDNTPVGLLSDTVNVVTTP